MYLTFYHTVDPISVMIFKNPLLLLIPPPIFIVYRNPNFQQKINFHKKRLIEHIQNEIRKYEPTAQTATTSGIQVAETLNY